MKEIFWVLLCRSEFIRTYCSRHFVSDKIIMMNQDVGPAFEQKDTDMIEWNVVTKLCIVETRCVMIIFCDLWKMKNVRYLSF